MPKSKKYIGVLGLGSRSTLHYINRLNEIYNQKYLGYSTCPIKLLNANFDQINPFLPDRFDKLKPIVKSKLDELNDLGVQNIIVPNITLHETIDQSDFDSKDKLIHPIKSTIKQLQEKKISKVVIYGSAYTMTSNYLTGLLGESGIEAIIPELADIQVIDDLRTQIYAGVKNNIIFETNLKKYCQFPALVSCTELSLVAKKFKNQEIFDLAEIQINEAIKNIELAS